MNPNTANIKAVITAEDRASKTLKNFGDEADKMSGKLKAGLAAAGIAAAGFAVTSVKAFMESQDVMAQTNAVIKSTGGVAGVTADQVSKLAGALQKVTKFSDEEVQSAQNLLLTFKAIGKDIFPQVTELALDMATRFNMDLKQASISLGKALQDPIRGVAQLRRQGIDFSADQQLMIKTMVETNRLGEAQAFVMAEIAKQAGGAARAAGETFAGRLAILKNTFNDVQEGVGRFIVNGLYSFITALQSTLAAIRPVVEAIVNFFKPSIEALVNTFQTRLLPSLQRLYEAMSPGLITVLKALAIFIGATVVATIWVLINSLNVVVSTIGGVIRAVSNVIGWFGNLAGAAVNTGRAIVGAFTSAFNAVARAWNSTVGKIKFTLPDWVPGLGGKGFSVPQIPQLAEGGIVRQPTLAMIGEKGPEAVVPLNKGLPGTVNITIQAGAFMGTQLEARKFAKVIMDAYKDLAASKNMSVPQMMGR